MGALIRWGARTAVTKGHPLRWLGLPAVRLYVGLLVAWAWFWH